MTKPITKREYLNRLYKGHYDIVHPRFPHISMPDEMELMRARRVAEWRLKRAYRVQRRVEICLIGLGLIAFYLVGWSVLT